MLTRRAFFAALSAAFARSAVRAQTQPRTFAGLPDGRGEWRGDSSIGAELRAGRRPRVWLQPDAGRLPALDWEAVGGALRARFPDLRRHFVFEYYPWYGADPWRHWNDWGRRPPDDIAAPHMPALGPYDSRSRRVVEQHARWIAESGAGAINVSWWGRDSYCDRAVPLLMDVMRDHGIHVTFHLEPYRDDRVLHYADDVVYLLREYGDRRRWDCLLLLAHADGSRGPVFKSFRTILPREVRDCHGRTHRVRDYVADAVWRRTTDRLRRELDRAFDRVTLLADSLDTGRTQTGGFDGIAVFDNYVRPASWPTHAAACARRDLLFSFNINPGFDAFVLGEADPETCYVPPPFEPGGHVFDWSDDRHRERAARASLLRIQESAQATLRLQTDERLTNAREGFFLTYINSFNEWHEGTSFEPMLNAADLPPRQRTRGYHNPADGGYRLRALQRLIARIVGR